MLGNTYKIKIGKYKGVELKDIPPSYLLMLYDKGWLSDEVAFRFVANNEVELRKMIKK